MIRRNEQRPTVSTTVQSEFITTDYNSKRAGMMLQRAASAAFETTTLTSVCNGCIVFWPV
jgi:hypothetical protein